MRQVVTAGGTAGMGEVALGVIKPRGKAMLLTRWWNVEAVIARLQGVFWTMMLAVTIALSLGGSCRGWLLLQDTGAT